MEVVELAASFDVPDVQPSVKLPLPSASSLHRGFSVSIDEHIDLTKLGSRKITDAHDEEQGEDGFKIKTGYIPSRQAPVNTLGQQEQHGAEEGDPYSMPYDPSSPYADTLNGTESLFSTIRSESPKTPVFSPYTTIRSDVTGSPSASPHGTPRLFTSPYTQNQAQEPRSMFGVAPHYGAVFPVARPLTPVVGSSPLLFAFCNQQLEPIQLERMAVHAECCLNMALIHMEADFQVPQMGVSPVGPLHLVLPRSSQGSVGHVEVTNMTTGMCFSTLVLSKEDLRAARVPDMPEVPGLPPAAPTNFSTPTVGGGPGDVIKMSVRYLEVMDFHEGSLFLHFPLTLPQSCLPPNAIMSDLMRIEVRLQPGLMGPFEYEMTSHPFVAEEQNPGELQLAVTSLPSQKWENRDLQVQYKVWGPEARGMLLAEPPAQPGSSEVQGSCASPLEPTLCLSLMPPSPGVLPVHSRSMLVLLDFSASMTGAPLKAAIQALEVTLDTLLPTDFLNIVGFSYSQAWWRGELVSASPQVVKKCKEWLKTQAPTRGSTDLMTPLMTGLDMMQHHMAGKGTGTLPLVYLITDGATDAELRIVSLLHEHLEHLPDDIAHPRINTLAVGPFCNHHFLRYLARTTGGHFRAALQLADMSVVTEHWLVATCNPVITDIEISVKDEATDCHLKMPMCLPDLFLDHPLVLPGKYTGTLPSTVELTGRLANGDPWSLELPTSLTTQAPLAQMYAPEISDTFACSAWATQQPEEQQQLIEHSLAMQVATPMTEVIGFTMESLALTSLRSRLGSWWLGRGYQPLDSVMAEGLDAGLISGSGPEWSSGNVDATLRNESFWPETAPLLNNTSSAPPFRPPTHVKPYLNLRWGRLPLILALVFLLVAAAIVVPLVVTQHQSNKDSSRANAQGQKEDLNPPKVQLPSSPSPSLFIPLPVPMHDKCNASGVTNRRALQLTARINPPPAITTNGEDKIVYVEGGDEVMMRGINYFGFNNNSTMLDGLWAPPDVDEKPQTVADVATVVYQLDLLGFNAVRIPFTFTDLYDSTPVKSVSIQCAKWSRQDIRLRTIDMQDPDVLTPRSMPDPAYFPPKQSERVCNDYVPNDSVMTRFLWTIQFFVANGFYVLLDYHPEKHMDTAHPEYNIMMDKQAYVSHWVNLWCHVMALPNWEQHLKGRVMLDLFNEPDANGIGWNDKQGMPGVGDMYLSAMDELEQLSPKTTIYFIAGAGQLQYLDGLNWGNGWITDTTILRSFPHLDDPNPFFQSLLSREYRTRVVISPHIYSTSVTGLLYSPENPESEWDKYTVSWGYLSKQGYCYKGACQRFPIVPGEMGGRFTPSPNAPDAPSQDQVYYTNMAHYFSLSHGADDGKHGRITSWFWWCYNANSGDTGGIVTDDWNSLHWVKLRFMKRFLGLRPWWSATR